MEYPFEAKHLEIMIWLLPDMDNFDTTNMFKRNKVITARAYGSVY